MTLEEMFEKNRRQGGQAVANLWPGRPIGDDDLDWLVANLSTISVAWGINPTGRPLKVFPDGRVRIDFVGTFASAKVARKQAEARIGEGGAL